MDKSYLERLLDDALGALSPLLEDETVREVMVNAPDDVWIERGGKLEAAGVSCSAGAGRTMIQVLLALSGRAAQHFGEGLLLDTAWRDWRLSAVLPPVAVRGPALCFRKHGSTVFPLASFLAQGTTKGSDDGIRQDGATWPQRLVQWVRTGRNILVCGATGAGKTALLNALIGLIPATQRLVVIEDTRELLVRQANYVTFEANPACQVTLRDLLRQALRFRPDRLVVGEVRGAEAFDLVQAMNTGHRGCLGTLHANHAEDALHRLAQLVLQAGMGWSEEAVARQIARTVHGVVHVERLHGKRRIRDLQQLEGYENGRYRMS